MQLWLLEVDAAETKVSLLLERGTHADPFWVDMANSPRRVKANVKLFWDVGVCKGTLLLKRTLYLGLTLPLKRTLYFGLTLPLKRTLYFGLKVFSMWLPLRHMSDILGSSAKDANTS